MARLCGATLGLFAFSITVFLSLAAGNSIEETLWRALSAMFIFCGIGLVVGWVSTGVLDEYAVGKHKELFGEEEARESTSEPAEPEEEEVTELQVVGS